MINIAICHCQDKTKINILVGLSSYLDNCLVVFSKHAIHAVLINVKKNMLGKLSCCASDRIILNVKKVLRDV